MAQLHFNRPARAYAGYIFDCDGTLAHSMHLHLKAWNAGLRAANAPFVLDGDNFMGVAGMSLQQTITHWNQTHQTQIDPELVIATKNAFYQEHFASHVEPIESIVAFARELHASSKPIAVASGGHREDVERTLRHIGVADIFAVVVTADDVKLAKPAPDLFLLAAERLGLEPVDCLVLEDSPLGVEAADRAGMDSILLPKLI